MKPYSLFHKVIQITLLAFVGVSVAAGEPIIIGQSAPLSGSNADIGNDLRTGANAYFNKANEAGGINGRQLKLITFDDKNDIGIAESNTIRLIEKESVIALFGYASATLSMPALAPVMKANMAFVAPLSGAERIRIFNDNVFTMRAGYDDEINAFLAVYIPNEMRRIAVLHYDDTIGIENFEIVKKRLATVPNSTIVSIALKRNREDIAMAAKRIGETDLNAVIVTILPTPAANIIKSVRRAPGNQPHFAAISFTAATPLSRQLGDFSKGVTISTVVPLFNDVSVAISKEYVQAMAKYFPATLLSMTGFESFIGAKVLVEALKRTKGNATRAQLLRSLQTMGKYDTGGYTVKFNDGNHNGSSYVALIRMRGPDNFTTY